MKNTELIMLAFFIILASIPIGYGFFYIDKYAVNIPLDDQWGTIVPWTIQYYEGRFNPARLITESQNDSRLLFPSLIMLSISVVTRMDIKAIFYAGYLFYICFMVLIAWLLFKELKIRKKYFFLLLLPVFYYSFNPYYLFRFIYNLGSMLSLMILLALLTIIFLDGSKKQDSEKRTYLFFGLSILLGVMCSFSGAIGLTIWFAGLLQISLQQTNEKIKKIIFWILGAGILFYTYYIALGFRTQGIHGTEGYTAYVLTAVTYPVNKFLCFMGVLGAEVAHNGDMALFFGFLLTGIFILLLYTNRNSLQLDKYSKWYALMAFGSLTGLALALTRSGAVQIATFGSPERFFYIPEIRHSLYIFLPMMCIYILALIYTKDSIDDPRGEDTKSSLFPGKKSWNMVILGMILTLMVCGALLHVIPGIEAASQSHEKNVKNQYYLLNYGAVSDNKLKQVYLAEPDVNEAIRIIKYYAQKLEKLHLNVFANRTETGSIITLATVEPDKKMDSSGNNLNPDYFNQSPNIQIGKSAMPAIFEHPQDQGSILVYNNYTIPKNSHLEFYIGMDEKTWDEPTNDGVTFEIRIAKNAIPIDTMLFSKSINPAKNPNDRSWQYQSIDLINFSDQRVDIKLITHPNNVSSYDWAWWGDPKIVS